MVVRTDTCPSIVLSDAPVEESDEDKPGVILDYDIRGNVLGLEILDASKRIGEPHVGGVRHHAMSAGFRRGLCRAPAFLANL